MMHTSPHQQRWLLAASYASVATALALISIKLFAWLQTGSTGILASLVDSVTDGMSSVINMIAIRYALKPADEDHRFGHGKAEQLASLGQAAFIVGSAMIVLLHALEGFLHPDKAGVEAPVLGMWMMGLSLALTIALVLFQMAAIRMTRSLVLRADSLHYKSDVATTLAVLAGLWAASYGLGWIDGALGVGIALYMCLGAASIAKESLHVLMDRQLPPEIDEQIIDIVQKHPEVKGLHDLRTRQSGMHYLIQLHLEMDDDLSLLRSHDIVDTVEAELKATFPHSEIIIHQDPTSSVPMEVRGHFGGAVNVH